MVTKENRCWPHVVLLCDLIDACILGQWRASAPQRAVSRDMNPLFLAEIYNFLLREERVVLDLIGRWNDSSLGEKLFEILDRVVGYTDSFDFVRVRLDERLETLPRLDVVSGLVNVPRAIGQLWEEWVVP